MPQLGLLLNLLSITNGIFREDIFMLKTQILVDLQRYTLVALSLIIIPELFRMLKGFVPYLFAGIMILVIFVMPQGLVGLPGQIGSIVKGIRESKGFTNDSGS